ncbi:MAG: hypothetical protein ACI9EF_001677 [Pseudohongiellaceae bacterium]|jgi:hypothetical protein
MLRERAKAISTQVRRCSAALVAVALLSPAAAACPYCSLSQGADTLVYILAFLVIPYVIVGGTWLWVKRLMASEVEG